MTQDLAEFFCSENLEYACIIGHSMGGKVAMNYTLQNPSKIKKLVVIDIALRSYSPSGNFAPQAFIHQKIVESLNNLDISVAKTRLEIENRLSVDIQQKPLRQFLLKNLKRNHKGKFYWGLNIKALKNNLTLLLNGVDTENKTFHNPVLVISGVHSGYINSEDKTMFRKVFPRVRIEELDSGHWVHAEHPDKLIELLVDFLPLKDA